MDLGLYEEKVCRNGNVKHVKATGILKQRLIVTFSRKMMEYQRAVRNRQIERAFLICYTALLVYRLLEAKLDDQRTHITTDDLISTLRNMSVVNAHDVQYMSLYEGSKALDALTQLTGMVLDRLYYRPKELNQMLKKHLI
jgi:hypothetical protein